MHSKCFPPIIRPDARVLVLGSLPGRMSLEHQKYYAQPRNAFWRIMGDIFGFSVDLPYEDRIRKLQQNHVALWEVCASAYRPGSLDSNLSEIVLNNFHDFFDTYKKINLVCCNGGTAGRLYTKKVLPTLSASSAKIPVIILPSTSPAHAGMPFAEKLSHWSKALHK